MNGIVLNKAATVERCLQRVREEFGEDFRSNLTRQDAIVLNLKRACQGCIDLAAHVVKRRRLGIPQTTRDLFELLTSAGIIDESLGSRLQAMVSFRNIAVRDYTALNLDIVESIVRQHLTDFTDFTSVLLRRV